MAIGTIISFLEQQYGFIKGDDGKKYFFHHSDIIKSTIKIEDNQEVEFDPIATQDGYAAKNVVIKDTSSISTYIVPKKVYISKSSYVKGWEIMERSDFYISCTDKNLNTAKSDILHYAKVLGANALINYEYDISTESESTSGGGTYNYSVHTFTADVVNIAKKSRDGNYLKSTFHKNNINKIATELFIEGARKTRNSFIKAIIATIIITLMAVYGYYYDVPDFNMNFFNVWLDNPTEIDKQKIGMPLIFFGVVTYIYWKVFFNTFNEWLNYKKY